MDTKDSGSIGHIEIRDKKPIYHDAVGTVRLVDADEVVLIPTPSPDPRGSYHLKQQEIFLD